MYRPIHTYGTHMFEVPGHREMALPALVEDSEGFRLLITDALITFELWSDASQSGAQGLIIHRDGGWFYCPTTYFIEHRRENRFAQAYELADKHMISCVEDTGLVTSHFIHLDEAWRNRNVSDNPFVHLHTHSEFSWLDGYSTMDEIGEAVVADGQQAIGLTDHGVCAGHPALHKMTTDLGIHPVFGIEAYFVDDRTVRENPFDYWHLVLWAADDEGLRNLWSLSTESYRSGFYANPRMDWEMLTRRNSGLIASTACLRGPLSAPFTAGDHERALANLGRLGDIFGDRLYIEMHANHLPAQREVNRWLVDVSRQYGVEPLAAVDSHYAKKEHQTEHQTWLTMQIKKDAGEDADLFAGEQDYHLMTGDEVQSALSWDLPEDIVARSIANTTVVAQRCTAEIRPKKVNPVYSRATTEHPDPVQHDAERMVDAALANWSSRVPTDVDQAPYFKLFEYECPMLIDKKYPGYYLITADFVCWAKDHGILVGPGRGSGAASLVAYLMRITEIDPVEGDLLLDRFMTPGRKSLPDFDIDFPSSRGEEVLNYVRERWGPEHVAQVGTHMRIKNKSAFRDVQRAIAARLPGESYAWVEMISKIISAAEASTAGLGLTFEELMLQVGDLLEPYLQRMPELFELARKFRGRLKTYGRHAAGIIIDPDHSLEDELPMRLGEGNGPMVTQFDMDALEYLGKVKFDFLKLRNLDTIQEAVDHINANEPEHPVDLYSWKGREEYSDPEVFSELSDGWTMGVFQIETSLGTRTTKAIRPRNRFELTDVITIGRPGPMRSGLDKLYLSRRNGTEPVTYADPRMEPILASTFGCILYQEQVMAICQVLAGYTADEADGVRKILGKKKIELVADEGRRFIERAVENHTDRQVATHLWSQMAEFARYSFNKAHAYAYATLGIWTAWLKVHFPREFLTASMATVDKERVPQFVSEARRLGYQILPPDINESKLGFTADGLVVRYGLLALSGVGDAAVEAILEGQPYTSYDDFLERKGAKCNMGHVKRLVAIGAFDSLVPNRRELEARVIDDTTGVSERCVWLNLEQTNEFGLPCNFDWSSEPVKVGRTGKPLKTQPQPPKRCTKGCRNYTKRSQIDYSGLPFYDDAEIREREVQMLGVFLSSSPFDRVPPDVMSNLLTADDLAVAEPGTYATIGVVSSARPDPKGRDFGFVTLTTPSGEMSAILYRREWERYRANLRKGSMILSIAAKADEDRFRLVHVETL